MIEICEHCIFILDGVIDFELRIMEVGVIED